MTGVTKLESFLSLPTLERRRVLCFATSLGLSVGPGHAWSQSPWPTKPITIVVPFTPGTGIDVIARTIAPKLHHRVGQPVVVDNKPGASGNIGFGFVANATADGHTLLLTANGFVMNPGLFQSVPYDPVRSFLPIAQAATGALAFAVNPEFPARTLRDAIQLFKSKPGKYAYASPGNGTPQHLAMELFKLNTGTSILHIPYRGSAGAITDLIAGQVQAMIVPLHSALGHVNAGRLRMLAVAQQERVSNAPDLPTFREQGVRNSDVDLWYGLLAPAGTPAAVAVRLNREVNEILALPDVRESLDRQGLTTTARTPEAFAELIARDQAQWANVIRRARITAD